MISVQKPEEVYRVGKGCMEKGKGDFIVGSFHCSFQGDQGGTASFLQPPWSFHTSNV